jgi:two-component system, response regulator PdtaR
LVTVGVGQCQMQVEDVDEVGTAIAPEHPVVLVAEDEILVRMNIADCLRSAGFLVVEAASADEARVALMAISEIDAVFSDVNMPAMQDGIGLAMWMAVRLPDVPVILTSGNSSPTQAAAVAACPNVTDYVAKPYACPDIERLLRQRIAGRRASPA